MTHEMTPEVLKDACKKNGGFAQPTLNDQLFLQCKGFSKIQNLEPYINLKVLWLEQNGIAVIEGLEKNTKLVSLFLQNNVIRSISGLSALANLRIINLSHNYLTSITGLADSCPLLETLQISHNRIASLKACEDLWKLSELSSVDLSFNKIEGEPVDASASDEGAAMRPDLTVVNFFKKLPMVTVIYIHGNPLTHGMKNYRKNMIVHLPQLTYLDERPVFPDERAATEAWGRGGEKAEAEERLKIRQAKKEELESCVQTMQRAMEANRETRDRLTREWEARREVEREELKVRRQEMRKAVQLVDAKEYEARGGIEVDESDAWFDLESDMESMFNNFIRQEKQWKRIHEQQEEVEKVRLQVEEELRDQEERIALVLKAANDLDLENKRVQEAKAEQSPAVVNTSPSKHVDPMAAAAPATKAAGSAPFSRGAETMEYWIRQLDQTDDEILSQMESDLQGFLKELEPGLPKSRVEELPDEPTESSRKKKSTVSKKPAANTALLGERSVAQAVAVTAASLKEGKPVSGYSREALWETYYAWETKGRK